MVCIHKVQFKACGPMQKILRITESQLTTCEKYLNLPMLVAEGEQEEQVLSPQEPRTKCAEKSKRPAQFLEATEQ